MAGIIFNKASGLNDSIYGKSQEPIKALLEQNVEAFEQESIIDKVFVEDTTTNFAEKYDEETSLGDFEAVGESGAYPKSGFQEGYSKTIEPDTWKNSFEVSQEMIEDVKMGKVKSKAYGFTLSYARTKEKFAAIFFNSGNAASVTFGPNNKTFAISCADGQALFSTAHPSITGGTGNQSNYYNAAFGYDNLCLAEEKMQNYTDHDGNILNIMPDTIIIPNKARIKKAVFDVIGTEDGKPGTANKGFNYHLNRWNVIISPYIKNPSGATSDVWFLMDSRFNNAANGLVWLNRIKLTVKSYIDENTDNNIFKGRARHAAAPNNWRAFLGCYPGIGGSALAD
jgi:hypothetical protein